MSNGKGEAYFSVRVRLGVGGEVGGGGGEACGARSSFEDV